MRSGCSCRELRFPVAERVAISPTGVSVSRTGAIAFRASSPGGRRQLVWFDRTGKEVGHAGEPVNTNVSNPALSPDGQRVAFYRNVDGNTDIWLLDAKRGVLSRFTSDAADDVFPLWSPDGGSLVFSSNRSGVHDLYRKPMAGGSEELLLATSQAKLAIDWSRDGRFLLFSSRDPKTGLDIWALPLDGKAHLSGRPDELRRAERAVLPRWPLDRLSIERIRPLGRLHPAVLRFYEPFARLPERRKSRALAARRKGDLLPGAGRPTDGRRRSTVFRTPRLSRLDPPKRSSRPRSEARCSRATSASSTRSPRTEDASSCAPSWTNPPGPSR